jgi:hypothetical protein
VPYMSIQFDDERPFFWDLSEAPEEDGLKVP